MFILSRKFAGALDETTISSARHTRASSPAPRLKRQVTWAASQSEGNLNKHERRKS